MARERPRTTHRSKLIAQASQIVSKLPPESRDLALIGLLTALSLVPHLAALGFYSDDWDFLSRLVVAPSQRLPDLFDALVYPQTRMRPGQTVYLAVLYRLFGLEPTGYHVANAAVLTVTALAFYLVLRRLAVPRAASVAIPLLYVVLPHYSTARIWYASFQAPLSMLLYFTSLLAGLRSLDGSTARPLLCQAVSLLALAASTLLYEVTLLLFLLNAALYAKRALGDARSRGLILAGLTLFATLAAVGFKLLTATKVIASPKLGYLLSLFRQALWIDGVVYGLAAPRTLWRAARLADSADIIMAISLAAAATWYLGMVMTEEAGSSRWRPWDLVAKGTLVAALGLGVFVGTPVGFHPSGANNRLAIASAAGVAMATVGLVASVTARLAPTVRTWAFAGAGGTVIGASALMSGAITTQWVQASAQALTVFEKVTRILPTLRSGTAVLLVGTCPYVGPGIVFESNWDLRGALRLHFGDTTLLADVVTASTRVAGDGVHTKIYGSESIYPYGSLLAVDAARGTARPLRDSATAADYLQTLNRGATACRGREGYGVKIF